MISDMAESAFKDEIDALKAEIESLKAEIESKDALIEEMKANRMACTIGSRTRASSVYSAATSRSSPLALACNRTRPVLRRGRSSFHCVPTLVRVPETLVPLL
jgi:hypothetical protein